MKKKSLLASLLIFTAGLLLLVAAGILLHKLIPLETEKYIFMWNSIGVVFILAFVPIFFEQVTVRNADRIVVIEDGRVLEEGTHAQLLAAGGEYARLYNVQRLEY